MKETDDAHQRSVQQAVVIEPAYRHDAQRQANRDVRKDVRFGSAHYQRNDSCCTHFRREEQRQWQDGDEPRGKVRDESAVCADEDERPRPHLTDLETN